MTCSSLAWDGRRKRQTRCALPAGHDGAHDDGECVWTAPVPSPEDTLRARVLAYITEEPWSTSADLVEDLGCKLQQASTTLAKLYTAGKLERRRMLRGKTGVLFAYRAREMA